MDPVDTDADPLWHVGPYALDFEFVERLGLVVSAPLVPTGRLDWLAAAHRMSI